MLDSKTLQKKICENNLTNEKVAQMLAIELEEFNAKMHNSVSCFSIREVIQIVQILKLNGGEADKIFFA